VLGREGAYRTYFCRCSRRDIETAASAPHASDGSVIYPGTCRHAMYDLLLGTPAATRLEVPDRVLRVDDALAGQCQWDLQKQIGDFVIRKNDGTPSYQAACVMDDHDMGITDIVRGDDLL